VQRLNAQAAELERPAVVERLVLVGGLRRAVHVDRRPCGSRQPAVARHVVGMGVGLEHVLDRDTQVAREQQAYAERVSGLPILVVSDRHLSKDGRKSMGPVRATPSAGLTLADPVAAHPRP
jgi:hypothetical protein